jgi:hypothetical protein
LAIALTTRERESLGSRSFRICLLAVALGACVGTLTLAAISDGSVSRAVEIKRGSVDGRPWRVLVHGGEAGQRCIEVLTSSGSVAVENHICEPKEPLEDMWQPALRTAVGRQNGSKTLVVLLTHRTVTNLRLRVDPRDGRRPQQIVVDVRALNATEAQRAHLGRGVAYAIGVLPGRGCITEVIAIYRGAQESSVGPCRARPPGS